MAVTQADLDQLRHEFEAKLAGATVEHMNTATAISAYGERFNAMDTQFAAVDARFDAVDARFGAVDSRLGAIETRLGVLDDKVERVEQRLDAKIEKIADKLDGVERRLDDKIDRRFNWQTVMFAALGFITLFSDGIRAAIGL